MAASASEEGNEEGHISYVQRILKSTTGERWRVVDKLCVDYIIFSREF